MKQGMVNNIRATVVLFILSMATFKLAAQTPDYFGNNPEWRMQFQIGWVGPCLQTDDYVLYVNGDTIIAATTYKTIYRRNFTTYTNMIVNGCSGSMPTYNNQLYGIVRQEGRKVYSYGTPSDALLYDFELNVGDTLPVTEINLSNNIVITQIDSIVIGSEYRRRFHLSGNPDITMLIEGVGQNIGYTGGFLDMFPPYFESAYHFICYSNSDTLELTEGTPYCYFNIGMEDEQLEINLLAYPNPADDWMRLKGQHLSDITKLVLINQLGQEMVISFQPVSEEEILIDITHLPSGMYQLEVWTPSTSFRHLKVYKQY